MKKSITLLCGVVLCCMLSSCTSPKPNTESLTSEQQKTIAEQFPPVNTVNAYHLGDPVTATSLHNNEFTYTVNSLEKTKELGDRAKSFNLFGPVFDEVVDENNVLTGKTSAVFISITVENMSDQKTQSTLLNSVVKLVSSKELDTSAPEEAQYLDRGAQDSKDPKGTFKYVFEPNEKTTFIIGYTVEDDKLDKLYYKVPDYGFTPDMNNILSEDILFIDLNS